MSDAGRKFIIQQDIFRGPVDLLYYLIQQKELDISEVSLSQLTDQYLQFVEIIKELDLDNIGEFLQIAATLLHIKARSLFPEDNGEEDDEDDFDATEELIGQLLEYRKYKLTGLQLAEKRTQQEQMFRRGYTEKFDFDRDDEGNPLEEVDLGSLLNVFTELMEQTLRNLPETVVYDDITIEEHIDRILTKLDSGELQSVTFREFILGNGDNVPSREFMCGAFIAGLELCRRHRIKLNQTHTNGEILIEPVSEEERKRLEEEAAADVIIETEPAADAGDEAETAEASEPESGQPAEDTEA